MQAGVAGRIGDLLGSRVVAARSEHGGDIGRAYRVDLADHRRCFVKHYAGQPPGLPACEARGLAWLAEPDCIDVARPLATCTDPPLLVLEWIDSHPPARDFAETLGRGLAELHLAGAAHFGFDEDNFIGSIPQDNTSRRDWAVFYGEARLRPLLRRAQDTDALPARLVRAADALIERLPSLCGPSEAPARLHGDLWSGNVMTGASGRPLLIDPAVYGGHREIDLAMLRLFGGVSDRTFEAYAEHHALAPDAGERVALHQLYPLLVHVVLFGAAWVRAFEDALTRYR